MAIKVCDAIMGSGKSSAAIAYMNEHPQQKFIYITPYLEEAVRIRESCPALDFKEPSDKIPEFEFKKYKHTVGLIAAGKNITSTHNMFLRYSDDMIEMIKEQGYTLIVDEAVEVLRPSTITASDMQLIEQAGWITKEDGIITLSPSFDYDGGKFSEVVALARGNRLVDMPSCGYGNLYYYWIFSKDILQAFKDVIVLTYLFESQTMKYYFDIVKLPYQKIGIRRDAQGGYHFSDTMAYVPEYTKELSSKIHIFDNDKMNAIGNKKTALSYTWYTRTSTKDEDGDVLRKNVYNFFRNYNKDKPADARLWAAYKNGETFIRGKGFYYSNIAFNAKATNNYRDRNVLAYCVNIFMQPSEKQYLLANGANVLEDEYALSVMIQWIWRSAIRDGQEIWIYIPSKRMRTLLRNWIGEVEQNYIHIKETTK